MTTAHFLQEALLSVAGGLGILVGGRLAVWVIDRYLMK